MINRFGYTEKQWRDGKEEMRSLLIERASARGIIPYSELVSKLKCIKINPEAFALGHMLGEISSEENAQGRGMLTVIVVHKNGDYQPGPGFFELAKELGRNTSNIMECWIKELHQVHDYWSKTQQPLPKVPG